MKTKPQTKPKPKAKPKPKPKAKPKTNKELKKLALDYYKGEIFTDRQCRNPEDVKLVFMPLVAMSKRQLQLFKEQEPTLIFEYISKSTRWSVNGYPTFLSFSYLVKGEYKKFFDFVGKFKNSIDEAMKA